MPLHTTRFGKKYFVLEVENTDAILAEYESLKSFLHYSFNHDDIAFEGKLEALCLKALQGTTSIEILEHLQHLIVEDQAERQEIEYQLGLHNKPINDTLETAFTAEEERTLIARKRVLDAITQSFHQYTNGLMSGVYS